VRAAPVRDESETEAMMAGLTLEQHGGVLVLPAPLPVAIAMPSLPSPPGIPYP